MRRLAAVAAPVAGGRTFRVGGVGGGEHVRPGGLDGLGAAVVDVSGGMQAQPGMAMFLVVPGEETLAAIRTAGPGRLG